MDEHNEDAPKAAPKRDLTDEERHDAVMADMRARHGRRIIGYFDEDLGSIVYRSPKRDAMQRFVSESQDDNLDKHVVMETLLMACGIHPDKSQLRAIFDELPGHVSEAARDVIALGRTDSRGRRGK
jgi:hypothetical protein